jgi:peptidoglycan/LPS O-acetylase OafA/YrhL
VRALAAYLVVISHFSYVIDAGFPLLLRRFLGEFHIGVTIFFVLSGFLITYRYYKDFHLTANWFKHYIKNRIARIYPMYFLLTLGAFIYYFITQDPNVTKGSKTPIGVFLLNITFFRGFFYQFWDSGIAQGWSLTVEECFYLSAPFIFFAAKKFNAFYIQPVILTMVGILLVLTFSQIQWHAFFGNFTFMFLFTFPGRCFEFFVGVQLARYVIHYGFKRNRKMNFTYTGLAMIFICVFVMALQPITPPWTAGLESSIGIFSNNYILPIGIALFFYGLLTETTLLKKLLAAPFVELLGKSSYIFYLIHLGWVYVLLNAGINKLNDLFFSMYDKFGVDWHSPFEYDALNLVYIVIILNAISIVLFKFIEEPVNHYIRRSSFLVKYKSRPKGIID